MTDEHKRKISEALKRYGKTERSKAHHKRAGAGNAGKPKPWRRGEKHPLWKGGAVGYNGIHDWIRKFGIRSQECAHCKATDKKLDWANVSQKYKRDLSDWMCLCRSCHLKYDNVLARSWITRKANNEKAKV